MLVYVRLPGDQGVDPAAVEEAALGAIGRSGAVLGASTDSVDLELADDVDPRVLLPVLAAALRRAGLPAATVIDLPESGQRFNITDF